MNMLEATLERANGDARRPTRQPAARSRSTTETLAAHPALEGVRGPERSILGIRPEHLEDAALAPDTPADRRLRGKVVLREALGSEIMVHFERRRAARAHRGRPRARGGHGRRRGAGARRRGGRDDGRRPLRRPLARARGRASPRSPSTRARCTSSIPRAVSGSTTSPDRRRSHDQVSPRGRAALVRSTALAVAAARRRHRRRRRRTTTRREAVSGSVSIIGDLDRRRAEALPGRARRLQEAVSGREGQVHVGRRQHCRRSSRRRSRAATRPTWRLDRPAGLHAATSPTGALKPIDFAQRRPSRRTTRPTGSSSARSTGKLYGLFFKGANKSTVWYNVSAFKDAGVKPPKTWPQLLDGGEDAQGVRARRRTRSAAPTAGRSPTCSRTSTSGRPARRSTTSCRRTRSSGPTRR